jgi:hypothetical protein
VSRLASGQLTDTLSGFMVMVADEEELTRIKADGQT